jgi:hypothetical protein
VTGSKEQGVGSKEQGGGKRGDGSFMAFRMTGRQGKAMREQGGRGGNLDRVVLRIYFLFTFSPGLFIKRCPGKG